MIKPVNDLFLGISKVIYKVFYFKTYYLIYFIE